MSRTLADFVIPAREARAFVVPRGAHLRIHLVEDRQVGDCCFFNAADPREVFHVGQTWALNVLNFDTVAYECCNFVTHKGLQLQKWSLRRKRLAM